jgi:hypothetical protein
MDDKIKAISFLKERLNWTLPECTNLREQGRNVEIARCKDKN